MKTPSFEERMQQCRAFLKEHGHLNIGSKYHLQFALDNDSGLKQWLQRMRTDYHDLFDGKYDNDYGKKGKKSKSTVMNRLEMLEELGFNFDMSVNNEEEDTRKALPEAAPPACETSTDLAKDSAPRRAIFDMRLDQCRQFKAEKGHLNIMVSDWASHMRSLYNQRLEDKEPLTNAQKEKLKELESLGFAFDRMFDVNLQKLVAFKAKTGHTRVPCIYDLDRALGHWAEQCRREHNRMCRGEKSKYLTFDRLRKLSAIGFTFKSGPEAVPWDVRFDQLKAYREEHGKDPRTTQGRLGCWVSKQRMAYNKKMDGKPKHHLSDEKEQKLKNIGFAFQVGPRLDAKGLAAHKAGLKISWDDRLADFVQWKEKHGHPYVPTVCDNEDKHLGRWVAKQRMRYTAFKKGKKKTKYGMMTAEHALKLTNAGFEFDASNIRRTPKDELTPVNDSESVVADVGEEQHDEFASNYGEQVQTNLPEWLPE